MKSKFINILTFFNNSSKKQRFALQKGNVLSQSKGFTLVELIIVMVVMTTLLSLGVITLIRSQNSASITATIDILVADLTSQQMKAMVGATEGRSSSSEYGVHFDTDKYVLFHGPTYSSSDSSNRVISIPSSLIFDNNSYPNGNVIFSRISGELVGYAPSSASIRLSHVTSLQEKLITINKYGVIISIE